ncbi:MAG: hypothetical protein ACKVTZ_00175 [Bacteroidia bacterium]
MNQISWSYLHNPFDNATKGSQKRLSILATDHHDKLLVESTTNAQIAALYQFFLPHYNHFKNIYQQTFSMDGIYQGNTQIVENLFAELSGKKIKQWDIWVQNVYLEGTPEYTMLFPNRRTPFQSGSYEARITNVKSLETTLALYPNLGNVLNDVTTTLQQLEAARTAQQGYEKQSSNLVKDIEDARVSLAKAMHYVFGGLLQLYYNELWRVETFYELKYLRATTSTKTITMKSYKVNAGARLTLFDGQLTDESYLTIKNTSGGELLVFTSANPTATAPLDALHLLAGESLSFYANEYEDGSGFNWLIVQNEQSSDLTFEVGKE